MIKAISNSIYQTQTFVFENALRYNATPPLKGDITKWKKNGAELKE